MLDSVGQTVEIIVLSEEPVRDVHRGTGDWEAAFKAVEKLKDYDFDAVARQREYDLKQAKDHLP